MPIPLNALLAPGASWGEAASGVLRYFSLSGEHHHRDEEEEIFPALLTLSAEDVADAEALVRELKADHVRMRAAWQALEAELRQVVEGQPILRAETVSAFNGPYRRHIERETRDLLPLVRRVMPTEMLRAMGSRMARRRGAV
jgi:hemerythrin-like domain-containing protein